jgi:hypothetical protein
MADWYHLISEAIAALDKKTSEGRNSGTSLLREAVWGERLRLILRLAQ